LPVARRRHTRGGAGRGTRTVIGNSDQYRIQYSRAVVWQTSSIQWKKGVSEIGARHQIGEVIAVNPNVGIVGSSDPVRSCPWAFLLSGDFEKGHLVFVVFTVTASLRRCITASSRRLRDIMVL